MTWGRTTESGFSLIEVLVVVVIISILASISIPIFFNQREKAWQAATEASLKNAATALTSAASGNNGSYEGIDIPELVANEGLKYNVASMDLVIESTSPSNYCISAQHVSWARTMYYDSAESRPGFENCSDKY